MTQHSPQTNDPEPVHGAPGSTTGRRAFLIALAGAGLWFGFTRLRGSSTPSMPPMPDEVPEAFREAWHEAGKHLGEARATDLAVLAADLLPPQALDDGREQIVADFAQASAQAEYSALRQEWDADPDRLDECRNNLDALAHAAGLSWRELAPERRTELLGTYFAVYAKAVAASKELDPREPSDPAELGLFLTTLRESLEIAFWEQPGLRTWLQARACEKSGS